MRLFFWGIFSFMSIEIYARPVECRDIRLKQLLRSLLLTHNNFTIVNSSLKNKMHIDFWEAMSSSYAFKKEEAIVNQQWQLAQRLYEDNINKIGSKELQIPKHIHLIWLG